MSIRPSAALCVLLLLACGDDPQPPQPRPTLSREELMDPETCEGCHPAHYREWKASMHAYASEDPVFRAMNELGQQETDGGMGEFCVKCHAPMAFREGETTDGRNLDEVPEHLKGVTCYFCHNVVSVDGDHSAQLTLANDTTMRGAIEGAIRPSAHRVAYSELLEGDSPESARLCGACHDIVNDHGVHLERTFEEYKASIFGATEEPSFLSCASSCHMPARMDLAAVDEESKVGLRSVHSHLFPGVDVALTEWPDRDAHERAVQCALADSAVFFEDGMSFEPGENILTLALDTNAGHNMPSGSAQDRRLWIELTAFGADGEQICQTGGVPDDEAVASFVDPMPCDAPAFPIFRDRIFDEAGEETHMFWRAAPSDAYPEGFENFTLMPTQQDRDIAHTRTVSFRLQLAEDGTLPARVRLRFRIRAMDHDVLEELIDHGLLDESIGEELPTFDIINGDRELRLVNGQYEWQPTPPYPLDCFEVACELHPDAPDCN